MASQVAGLVHQVFVLLHIDKPAGHYIRAADHIAGLRVQSGHHNDNAVLGQMLTVVQNNIAHIAHAQAVYIHFAGRHSLDLLHLRLA